MPDNYKLTFWDVHAGTGDVGAETRAQVAKAALALQEHPDVVFASSAGGYDDSEASEIGLLVPVDYNPLALQPIVERALLTEGLTLKVSLKPSVSYFDFEEPHLASLNQAADISDLEAARTQIDELVKLSVPAEAESISAPGKTTAKELIQHLIDQLSAVQDKTLDAQERLAAATTAFADFPSSVILEPFSVTPEKLQRLKNARGDNIETEIAPLQKALETLSTEKSTNTAVILMIASGLVTVGKLAWSAYTAVQAAGSLSALISGTIAAAGGIASVALIALAIVAVIGILFLLFKPDVNDMLLVSSALTELRLDNDYIINGERNNVTTVLSAAPDPSQTTQKPMAYPAGWFIYSKYSVKGVPIGFYGSTAGLSFKRTKDNQYFSVGVDCPNTVFGTNGVQLRTGDNAKAVANAVDSKSKDTDSIRVGGDTVTVSRAAKYGSVNYILCWTGR